MSDKIDFEYLEDADILEIFFERGPATGTVQVADHITLRFRKKDRHPLSLILENFTYLTQVVETGPWSFPLKIDRLPLNLRRTVLRILSSSPVNQYLKILSYHSPRAKRTIPIAYLSHSPAVRNRLPA